MQPSQVSKKNRGQPYTRSLGQGGCGLFVNSITLHENPSQSTRNQASHQVGLTASFMYFGTPPELRRVCW